jgi:hypothetical protein
VEGELKKQGRKKFHGGSNVDAYPIPLDSMKKTVMLFKPSNWQLNIRW